MEFASRLYLRARETVVCGWRGQTYTEYALVLLFAVIVMITGYQKMGIHIRNAVAGLADSVADA